MKKIDSDEYKKIAYDILYFFDNLCRKNDIKYSLFAGSLIGAIREHGIIPWDDDIDIVMDKSNYEKLCNLIEMESFGIYKFINHKNTTNYNFPFIKLIDTRTHIIEPYLKKQPEDYGIYIDIFFYNNTSMDGGLRKKHYKKISSLVKISTEANIDYANLSILKIIKRHIKNFIISIVGKNRILKTLEREYRRYSHSKYLISCWPIYSYSKEIQKTSDIEAGYTDAQFGPIKAMIFKNYDSILKITFGDYMTPPPEDKRISHNIVAYWKDGYEQKN